METDLNLVLQISVLMIEGTILDLTLHTCTFLLALILFGISLRSYTKKNNKKFMYVFLAFGAFALKEGVIVASVLNLVDVGLTGISHILNLMILTLFFGGTMK